MLIYRQLPKDIRLSLSFKYKIGKACKNACAASRTRRHQATNEKNYDSDPLIEIEHSQRKYINLPAELYLMLSTSNLLT